MKISSTFIVCILFISYFFVNASEKAVLVHNTLKEIDHCKGKLHLKLIRVWGGDEEEDENKFFETPSAVAIDGNKLLYICDWHNHCIKVFNNSGSYLRTIGRKGQGPGDLFGPQLITLTPEGEIMVFEWGSRRFQWFSSEGKSKRILKYKGIAWWIGITTRNEIAFYDSYNTFMNRKLISIMDIEGKVIHEFGKYHDMSKKFLNSEKLHFSIDNSDNIYAANMGTPVIRKYSPGGKLIMVITFETPFKIPVQITLNSTGDEIERKEEIDSEDKVKIVETSRGVTIQHNNRKSKRKFKTGICSAVKVDSQNRIYIVSMRRLLTEKEESGTAVSGSSVSGLNRSRVNYDIVENIDYYRLLVFSPNGRIIAESTLTTFCDNLYIYNNRIFVIDGFYNQRVLEYEMSFEN